MDRRAVIDCLPQGDGFVFVDSALLTANGITGSYTITGEECFAGAHFPDRYVFPASIMVEAVGQLGIVYLSQELADKGLDAESIFFISSEDVSCRRKCGLRERLDMSLTLRRKREPLAVFSGAIHVGGELVLKISSLTLSFSTKSAG